MDSITNLRHNRWSLYAVKNSVQKLIKPSKQKIIQFKFSCINSIRHFVDENNIIDTILEYSNHINILNAIIEESIFLYFITFNNNKGVAIDDIIKFEKINKINLPIKLRFKLLLCNCNSNFNIQCNGKFENLFSFNNWKINNDKIMISPYIAVNFKFNTYINIQTQKTKYIDTIEEIIYPVKEWCNAISNLIQQYQNQQHIYNDEDDFMYNFIDKQIDELNYQHGYFMYNYLIEQIYNLKYKLLIQGYCRASNIHFEFIINMILNLYPFFLKKF